MSIKYKIKSSASSFFIIFITIAIIFPSAQVIAASALTEQSGNINALQQDRVRKEQLMPEPQRATSEKQSFRPEEIPFPHEENCYFIDKVVLSQDSKELHLERLRYFTSQAEGKCLGIAGIRLLAKTLQNEIIRAGYITTRVNLPEQNLSGRELKFEINAGKVGEIVLNKAGGDYINLTSTLPFKAGDVLELSDLEQGSLNLQRVPGSQVKVNLVPGSGKGESDIYIQREQDKYWQVGAWLNDAGSVATGRYQGGAALYLNNITSLSDTLFVSYGHDIAPKHTIKGNSNKSIGYSIPWGYWWLDLYASRSDYQQYMTGNWAKWTLNNKNSYYSAQLNRLISRTVHQASTVGLQIFDTESRYSLNDFELVSMHKKSAGWKAVLQHQINYDNAGLATTLSYQRKMPWFNSSNTVEQAYGLIDKQGRIITFDLQGSVNFRVYDNWLNYSPHFSLQYSPDTLSSLNRFSLANRWTVRGFDGEYALQDNKGWYWRNDISWIFPGKPVQPYIGVDAGQVYGNNKTQDYTGKTVIGSVVGLRGNLLKTRFDFFAGSPLKKPQAFHTDPLTLGFSLQWKY
ncbi:ShlB/FhaC/HecB family hemolysin secretion/activation protein [Pantoea agglomerans]|uniref:ShlB/FhaC/HecB family hemolysin secretion/activation protein n=1 Tax=Enterobacter agglomerans TaxID=549 RepID=UPI0013B7995D|nr:ShlB/FhaC/HecB family hemolysin secretion/activation protein [Pantoea agglomerans]NEG59666.1 ShlB/FhaC/HecB family hemolysin secretion/activation protein [Pantoea agglomerans]NEH00496.1 ShlB/FhaC/HecB family hemolysin secretion/activation protein [Pantoea agglomerans]NEH04949.1 ShlB/FhaC/HecB family hemolysin secretion/activation protein [Pantoea agglomerans]NEH15811.1 ShlB/FhaC/HecB family hemolysin secretion/activation protein [Pantoea agglomerans]